MLVVVIVVVSTSARPNRASRVAAAEEEDDARARSMTATSEERLSSLRSSKESGKEFFFFARSRKNEKSANTSFQSPHSTLALSLFSLACWSSSGARDLRVHLSAASPSLHLSRACTCSVSLPHDAPRRLRAKSLISFFFRQANTK